MLPTVELPRETERQAFVEKVRTFRATLPQPEPHMLDGMVRAAFGPAAEEGAEQEVEGYHWVYTAYGPVYTTPTWYQTGWVPTWQYTPWGTVYQPVPTGVWVP